MMVPEWMGNGWVLTWFTAVALVVSHLTAYLLTDRKIRFWLAYSALFLGGAALLTSFHSAVGAVNSAKTELLADRLQRAGVDLIRDIAASKDFLCNFKGMRTPFSPPDFEEIETQRAAACNMFRQIKMYAETEWNSDGGAFVPPDVGLATVTDPVWKQSADRLGQVTTEYQILFDQLAEAQPQPWLFWSALEPFIISASWSLGLALMMFRRGRKCVRPNR
ncbi:hypothetical protein ACVDG9_18390 [Roseibium sp. RP-7]